MNASAQALAAVRAAKNRIRWGEYAALRYIEKRGVTYSMYLVALRVMMVRAKRVQPNDLQGMS